MDKQSKQLTDIQDNNIQGLLDFYDSLLKEVTELKQINTSLMKTVNELKNEIEEKINEIEELRCHLNNLEQYGRGVNLEIQGLEVNGTTKYEDLMESLQPEDIEIVTVYHPKKTRYRQLLYNLIQKELGICG